MELSERDNDFELRKAEIRSPSDGRAGSSQGVLLVGDRQKT